MDAGHTDNGTPVSITETSIRSQTTETSIVKSHLSNLLGIQSRSWFRFTGESLDALGIDETIDDDMSDMNAFWSEFTGEGLRVRVPKCSNMRTDEENVMRK